MQLIFGAGKNVRFRSFARFGFAKRINQTLVNIHAWLRWKQRACSHSFIYIHRRTHVRANTCQYMLYLCVCTKQYEKSSVSNMYTAKIEF